MVVGYPREVGTQGRRVKNATGVKAGQGRWLDDICAGDNLAASTFKP
jgi:hypothetical protein